MNQLRKPLLDEVPRNAAEISTVFAPLTPGPLPRWGEGDRILLPFQRRIRHYILWSSIGGEEQSARVVAKHDD